MYIIRRAAIAASAAPAFFLPLANAEEALLPAKQEIQAAAPAQKALSPRAATALKTVESKLMAPLRFNAKNMALFSRRGPTSTQNYQLEFTTTEERILDFAITSRMEQGKGKFSEWKPFLTGNYDSGTGEILLLDQKTGEKVALNLHPYTAYAIRAWDEQKKKETQDS